MVAIDNLYYFTINPWSSTFFGLIPPNRTENLLILAESLRIFCVFKFFFRALLAEMRWHVSHEKVFRTFHVRTLDFWPAATFINLKSLLQFNYWAKVAKAHHRFRPKRYFNNNSTGSCKSVNKYDKVLQSAAKSVKNLCHNLWGFNFSTVMGSHTCF